MANKLTAWRIAAGLTIRELADRAGVGQGTISKMERGGARRLHGGVVAKTWLALKDAGEAAGITIPGRVEFVEELLKEGYEK